jgi:hypothetical protein
MMNPKPAAPDEGAAGERLRRYAQILKEVDVSRNYEVS